MQGQNEFLKFCVRCGTEYSPELKVCPSCGFDDKNVPSGSNIRMLTQTYDMLAHPEKYPLDPMAKFKCTLILGGIIFLIILLLVLL